MKIGLTGGFGCGKSTVAMIMKDHGYHSIDSDTLVKGLLKNDPPIIDAIKDYFGKTVFDETGAIDRKRLAHEVFQNPEKLNQLENILHPKVIQSIQTAFNRHPERNWVVEIPLLFEKKLEKLFDYSICIVSQVELQHSRLKERGFSDQQIQSRIAQQMPLNEKINCADFVITNNDSVSLLRGKVTFLVEKLRTAP